MLAEHGIVSPPRIPMVIYDSVSLDLEVGGVEDLGKWGNAKGYWTCQCVAYARTSISFSTVLRARNIWLWSGTIDLNRVEDPKEGDLVVTEEGRYGHVAVIERVSDDAIQIVEQNYLPCKISRRVLAIDDERILGFVTK